MRKGLWIAAVALLTVTIGVSACGRRGPLERPTSTAVTASGGEPAQPDRPDRSFILDGLLR